MSGSLLVCGEHWPEEIQFHCDHPWRMPVRVPGPPGITHPMFKIHDTPSKERFVQNASNLNKRLEGFQKLYQQHASGLFTMSSGIIPPGHPLYSEKNSVEYLKTENDKLLKQNIELKKKLDQKTEK